MEGKCAFCVWGWRQRKGERINFEVILTVRAPFYKCTSSILVGEIIIAAAAACLFCLLALLASCLCNRQTLVISNFLLQPADSEERKKNKS